MLKLWGRVNSINVQKVIWTLEELNIPFERSDAGMTFGVVNETFYKQMNPNSRVPTIDDDGFILWESNAIVRYLGAKHGAGTFWPNDLKQRADADRWMDWAVNHFWDAIRPVFVGKVRTPVEKRNMAQIEAGAEKIGQQALVLEQCLAGKDYVAGAKFTMGDIVVGVNLYRWMAMDLKRPKLPRIEAYYERLKQRPAFQKHIMQPLS